MWFEDRELADAPVHYDNEQAHAWMAGWEAAVEEYTRQINEMLAREQSNEL